MSSRTRTPAARPNCARSRCADAQRDWTPTAALRVGSHHLEADSAGIWMRGRVQVGRASHSRTQAFWDRLAMMFGATAEHPCAVGGWVL